MPLSLVNDLFIARYAMVSYWRLLLHVQTYIGSDQAVQDPLSHVRLGTYACGPCGAYLGKPNARLIEAQPEKAI